jgi:hypothetical protein
MATSDVPSATESTYLRLTIAQMPECAISESPLRNTKKRTPGGADGLPVLQFRRVRGRPLPDITASDSPGEHPMPAHHGEPERRARARRRSPANAGRGHGPGQAARCCHGEQAPGPARPRIRRRRMGGRPAGAHRGHERPLKATAPCAIAPTGRPSGRGRADGTLM